jgi:hypothetical protein
MTKSDHEEIQALEELVNLKLRNFKSMTEDVIGNLKAIGGLKKNVK